VNSFACQLLGYSQEELLGTAIADRIAPENRPRFIASAAQTQGGVEAETWILLHQDGTRIPVDVRTKNLPDGRWVAFVQDLRERLQVESDCHQAQASLQQSESRLESLSNNLPGMVYQYVLHPDGTDEFTYVSHRSQEIYEYPPDILIQNFDLVWGMIHPDDVERVHTVNLNSAQQHIPFNVEFRLLTPSGRLKWVQCISSPTPQANGDVLWDGIVIDISDRKQYELALRQQEQQLQDLCDSMPQFVWTSNAQGELQYVNHRWVEYSGLTVEQSQNPENIAACYHPDDVQLAFQQWATALETKQPCEFEGRLRAFDGPYRWFLTRIVPVFDDQGQVLRWYGTSTDITEFRQAKAALQQSEDRYRMAVTSAKLGTWDWDLILDKLKWDAACKAMFGLSPEAESNIDVFYAALHPDDRDRVTEVVQNVLMPDGSGFYDVEYRVTGIEDGIERWIAAKGQVYFSPTGQPVRFIGTVLDITEIKRYESERQRAETQLRDRQERLEAALFAAGTGTFRWDIHTNALTWDENLDRLFGLPPGETARSLDAFIQLVHPDDRQGVIDRCARCVNEGADFDMDFRVVYPNGTIRWLSDKGKTFFDESGNPVYMTGACVDITDRKRAEAALQQQTEALIQANRLKDEFLAVLSHELRTPLNPILGWTKLLKEQKLTSTKAAEALNVIERSTKQQLSLVNDLLDASAIIQGQLNLEVNPVDLTVIVNTAIETVQFAAQAKDITVDALQIDSKTSEAMLVLGDSGRLRQVFWNLLANAVKFTPEGGRVEVTLSRIINANGHHYAQVSITDSGIGISPEFLPWVFDHFRQADGSMTRRHGGLGLGLSIVRHIVELHGGTVTAASPGVGQGSTFTIKLPLGGASEASRKSKPPIPIAGSSAPSSAWTSSASPSPATPLNGIQILVVDDDLDNLELLRFLLQEYGAIVTAVNSAQKALQIISDAPPDLIISDIGMPEINGYEFIRQVRALPQGQQIPALAFTAFAAQEEQEQILASGFQTHLSKPVDPFKLLDVLAQWATI
jgi:PAS domain S-box-containing protein